MIFCSFACVGKRITCLFIILYLLQSCDQVNVSHDKDQFPVLRVPNHANDVKTPICADHALKEFFQVYYMGHRRDTITLNYDLFWKFAPPPPPAPMPPIPPGKKPTQQEIEDRQERKERNDSMLIVWRKKTETERSFKRYQVSYTEKYSNHTDIIPIYQKNSDKRLNSSITVDTTTILSKNIHWHDRDHLKKEDRVPAYAVFIKNRDSLSYLVGSGSYVALITEAKDVEGNWREITNPYIYSCGTGIPGLLLPPNELFVTSTLIYDGDFETTLRLKLGSAYSNEYRGKINKSQFRN